MSTIFGFVTPARIHSQQTFATDTLEIRDNRDKHLHRSSTKCDSTNLTRNAEKKTRQRRMIKLYYYDNVENKIKL